MTERGRHYPQMPPSSPEETINEYTDRLTGADRTDRVPYDHSRNRQCSIGFHEECSDPQGERCECPCHTTVSPAPRHDDPVPFAIIYPERKTYEDWLHASGAMFFNRTAVTLNFVTGAATVWPDINILLEEVSENEGMSFVWLEGWS